MKEEGTEESIGNGQRIESQESRAKGVFPRLPGGVPRRGEGGS
jgi:hypothetical protein